MDAFKLLGYGIVALVIILLVASFFSNPGQDVEKEITNGINSAQATPGKIYEKELYFKQGSVFNAANFENGARNVRFQCSSNDTCAGQKVVLGVKKLVVNENLASTAQFRCREEDLLDDCVVYFGRTPARLEVRNVTLPAKMPEKKPVQISFEVLNTGKLTAADIQYEVKFYFKRKEGQDKQNILRSSTVGQIKEIFSGQSSTISRTIVLPSAGPYKLVIQAESAAGGLFEFEKEITIEETAASCTATQKGTPQSDGDICKTEYLCKGCASGAECSLKWQENGIDAAKITSVYADQIYTEEKAINGECK